MDKNRATGVPIMSTWSKPLLYHEKKSAVVYGAKLKYPNCMIRLQPIPNQSDQTIHQLATAPATLSRDELHLKWTTVAQGTLDELAAFCTKK